MHEGPSGQIRLNVCVFRVIKEATKEKGTDDFLGKVILKLQVLVYKIYFSFFGGSGE